MVPVLAALPQPGAFPWFTSLSVLVVVAVGAFVARRALRRGRPAVPAAHEGGRGPVRLRHHGTRPGVVLDLLAGGVGRPVPALRGGRPDATLFLALLVELSVGALVVVLRDAWRLRR